MRNPAGSSGATSTITTSGWKAIAAVIAAGSVLTSVTSIPSVRIKARSAAREIS
jgi:hypothetical protein